jgi:folate-binding protein YgfZ
MFSLDEYTAAHESAVVSVRPTRGTIALTGVDRKSFLHALLTNDIAALGTGKGAYAAYLTPQGRMISDMRVIETGDRALLGVEAAIAAPLAERLDKLIFSEDAQVVDVSRELDEVGIHGPAAADVIARATGLRVDTLVEQYDNVSAAGNQAADGPYTVVRDDAFGVPGFDIYVPRAAGNSVRERLVRAGGVGAGDATLEVLRIEEGRPRFGVDMGTETIPLEAGIEGRAISFTKGCYVGQEVIIRVMHRGHGRVARRLVRLVLPSGSRVPLPGDKIFCGDQSVGEVTSAAESPKAGAPMAMGYVHRDHASGGSHLTIGGSQAVLYQPRD